MFHILKYRMLQNIATRPIESELSQEIETAGGELRSLIQKRFGKSLHIREVDTGSCGGCESEIISANNPLYDLQRFGVNFVASPRHADALLVTGCASKNMMVALKKTYEAMPEPKFIITFGDCALDGGIFKDSYHCQGAIKDILPVVLHIPGCPPSPLVLIKSLLEFLRKP